jgi:hypothetical protein
MLSLITFIILWTMAVVLVCGCLKTCRDYRERLDKIAIARYNLRTLKYIGRALDE